MPPSQEAGRDLWFDVETARGEREGACNIGAHDFVTGLHVGQRRAIKYISRCRQDAIGGHGDFRCARSSVEKPGSIHDIGVAGEDGGHQRAELLRIQLEIGILNGDDCTGGLFQPATDCAALAAIAIGTNDSDIGSLHRSPGKHVPGAIGRAVVDDEDLAGNRQVDRRQPIDDGLHGPCFVVNGNDDGEPFLARAHLRRAGAAFGGGAGLYCSITLLITAIGRPGAVKLSVPSTRMTVSFSPTMLTLCSSSGISSTMVSVPVGATAFSPPGLPPPPTRSTRSAALRNSLWTTARDSSVVSAAITPTVAVYFANARLVLTSSSEYVWRLCRSNVSVTGPLCAGKRMMTPLAASRPIGTSQKLNRVRIPWPSSIGQVNIAGSSTLGSGFAVARRGAGEAGGVVLRACANDGI